MHQDLSFWIKWFMAGPGEDRALARLVAIVPTPRKFYETEELRLMFPQVFRDPNLPGGTVWGFVFDRIMPLSEGYRRHVIARFVEPQLQEEAIRHPYNQYGTLVLQLGTEKGRPSTDPKMGNRPFALPELILEIGKEGVIELAETMAVTLAILHWSAHLDGQHVRFMAGAQPSRHHRTIYLSHIHNLHPFKPDADTVRIHLAANYIANRSFPRPVLASSTTSDDQNEEHAAQRAIRRDIWVAFRKLYLDVSGYILYRDKHIVGKEYAKRFRLPAVFLRSVEAFGCDTKKPEVEIPKKPYVRGEYDEYRERGPKPGEGEGSRMGPSRVWGGRMRVVERPVENTQFVAKRERDLTNIEEEGMAEETRVAVKVEDMAEETKDAVKVEDISEESRVAVKAEDMFDELSVAVKVEDMSEESKVLAPVGDDVPDESKLEVQPEDKADIYD